MEVMDGGDDACGMQGHPTDWWMEEQTNGQMVGWMDTVQWKVRCWTVPNSESSPLLSAY